MKIGKKMMKKINDKYANMGVKKKWNPAIIKTAKAGIDLGGVGLGTFGANMSSASSPLIAPIAGVVLLSLGHILGDQTGILRVCGASMIGYGVAKVQQENEPEPAVNGFAGFAENAKRKLGEFKNEWMKAFFIDRLVGSAKESSIDGFGAVDMSALDAIEQSVEQSAISHEMNMMGEAVEADDEVIHLNTSEDFGEELNYVAEEIDLSTI